MHGADDNKTTLERYLGSTIHELRQQHGLTIAQVAEQAGISRGMLSKIENAQTSPGLDVLHRIAKALGVSISTLFRRFDIPEGGAQFVKKGAGMEVVRKGTKSGHTYHLLAYDQGPRKLFEPFLITIENQAERFPVFEHPGIEFIHMLRGVIEYRHGQQTYILHPGDTLSFRADIPHGPEQLIKTPIQFLSIFIYGSGAGD